MLPNNGNATFAAPVNYGVGLTPNLVAVGDVNGDGKPDVAVASGIGVSVLLNNDNGTFAAAINYATGMNPASVALGDLNGDGKMDISVANNGSNNESVLLNTSQ